MTRRLRYFLSVVWLGVAALAPLRPAAGEDWLRFESAGVRYGVPGNASASDFRQAEAFFNFDLPWKYDLGKDWFMGWRLQTSGGWIGDGDDAAIFTIGPGLRLGREKFPVSVEGGISPTLLTHYKFYTKNFGCVGQFTSYLGINVDLTRHLRLGYRYQHMSNAHISEQNPGLNMNVFSLSYVR